MSDGASSRAVSPALGLAASLVPGGGFLCLGRPLAALCLGGAVIGSWMLLGLRTVAVLLYVYQAFAARNLARDLVVAAEGPLAAAPEAPPDPGATAFVAPPEDWATQRFIEAPELDAEGFLLELGSDFERFERGELEADAYAARKRDALAVLKVEGDAERDRVLETVGRLVEAGALSPEEGAELEERVHRA